jgi:hypothetical protein
VACGPCPLLWLLTPGFFGLLCWYQVMPQGAHPSVERFLALHRHLFPIRALASLRHDIVNKVRTDGRRDSHSLLLLAGSRGRVPVSGCGNIKS